MKRLAILGAGPVGLEAALWGCRLGFDVTIIERGELAENVRRWGHVRMFSPWALNTSAFGKEALGNPDLPGDACPTGLEYAQQYLLPLARIAPLEGRIRVGERVVAVSRTRTLKGDLIGKPARADAPFRILTRDRHGAERVHASELVFDCTGTYGVHNALGDGGIPALGEGASSDRISYAIDDVLGRHRPRYLGKRTLLVGAGHSAATSAVALANLAEHSPSTAVVWVARSETRHPYPVAADDPLPLRAALSRRANALAQGHSPHLTFVPGSWVHRIERLQDRLTVTLRSKDDERTEQVDRILANVGYGPDNSIYRELQIHECYASRGPMKLAAALLGEASADCLQQASPGPKVLRNPEPNFFILGSKSFGRNSAFLIQNGFRQVREVFELITGATVPETISS